MNQPSSGATPDLKDSLTRSRDRIRDRIKHKFYEWRYRFLMALIDWCLEKLSGESNWVAYAKKELEILDSFPSTSSDDNYHRELDANTMRCVRLFAAEGHSGFSASVSNRRLTRLLSFKPLTELTGADEEWGDAVHYCDVSLQRSYQNTRASSVFKDVMADGSTRTYRIDAIVWQDPDGITYTDRYSVMNISFPYEFTDSTMIKRRD